MLLTHAGAPPHAEAWLRRAQRQHPGDFWLNWYLATILHTQKPPQLEEAIQYYTAAQALRPSTAGVYINLGNALAQHGRLPQAIAAYEKAMELRPGTALVYYNLGNALRAVGRFREAVSAYRDAVRLAPNLAEAHCNLGQVLEFTGDFPQALDALKRGHELGSQRNGWQYPSGQWVEDAERLIATDEKFSAADKAQPGDAVERANWARCLYYKGSHTEAVRQFTTAFADQPALADEVLRGHRLDAARAAAAACDIAGIDDGEQKRLRRQSLTWMMQDLTAWRNQLTNASEETRTRVTRLLMRWRHDPVLAPIRDMQHLSGLSATDRRDFLKFWTEVDHLHHQLATRPRPRSTTSAE
jgi:tetratricopeptide (TPR) repeat protein